MINAGEFRARIEILQYNESSDSIFEYTTKSSIWGKAVDTGKSVVYSKYSQNTKELRFLIRKSDISNSNLIKYKNKYYFIVNILPYKNGLGFLEIICGEVEPILCIITKQKTEFDNEFNRPTNSEKQIMNFYGFMSEKYTMYDQLNKGELHNTIQMKFMLVVPHIIKLRSGEIVNINDVGHIIIATHSYISEYLVYEIYRQEDL